MGSLFQHDNGGGVTLFRFVRLSLYWYGMWDRHQLWANVSIAERGWLPSFEIHVCVLKALLGFEIWWTPFEADPTWRDKFYHFDKGD